MSRIRPTLVVIGIDCTCGCTIRSRQQRHPYIQIFIIKPEKLIHNQYLSSVIKMKINQYTSKTNILSLFYGLDFTFFVLNTIFNIITVLASLHIRLITKLPNTEQSSKGKLKTHKSINRQNQSTTGKQVSLVTESMYWKKTTTLLM